MTRFVRYPIQDSEMMKMRIKADEKYKNSLARNDTHSSLEQSSLEYRLRIYRPRFSGFYKGVDGLWHKRFKPVLVVDRDEVGGYGRHRK